MRFIRMVSLAPARNAVLIVQMASQEVQMGLAPRSDMVVVVTVGHRAAHDQEQDLGQRWTMRRTSRGSSIVAKRSKSAPRRDFCGES